MSGLRVELQESDPIALDADFSCAPGELVALVGPSGSGKTTILRTIAGLAHCTIGRISIDETVWFEAAARVSLPPQQRRVGFVFQSYALFPHLTARENVALASARPEADRTAHANELLARVRLDGLGARTPSQLSGGQQQRVALARALAREPQVLLLDEPFSAVDQVTRQNLYVELATLRRTLSMPIVLVTHDMHEAQRLADRVVILDAGSTLQSGTPSQLLAHPRNARVAQLLGLRNHFGGIFHRAAPGGAWGTLTWGGAADGLALRVHDKHRIDDGAAVTWVVPGECVSLSFGPRTRESDLDCTLAEVVSLGDVTQCLVQLVAAPQARVVVTVPTQTLRAHAARSGDPLVLALDTGGIHIMPVRHQSDVARKKEGAES